MEAARVVIYVDVDGVLNVGARDFGEAPILLTEDSLNFAAERDDNPFLSQATRCSVDRIASLAMQDLGDEEEGTFCKLACPGSSQLSPVLIRRLAGLMQRAGPNRMVVLASNWRRGRQAGPKVAALEAALSQHLGYAFAFDAQTEGSSREKLASERLRCIGEHLRSLFANGCSFDRPLRVLVLEDFFVTPLDGWLCEGVEVRTNADAEGYLRRCVPEEADLDVRLVHTYDEWQADSGLRVQVGTGLTLERCREAEQFLSKHIEVSPTIALVPLSSAEEAPSSIVKPSRRQHFAFMTSWLSLLTAYVC